MTTDDRGRCGALMDDAELARLRALCDAARAYAAAKRAARDLDDALPAGYPDIPEAQPLVERWIAAEDAAAAAGDALLAAGLAAADALDPAHATEAVRRGAYQ